MGLSPGLARRPPARRQKGPRRGAEAARGPSRPGDAAPGRGPALPGEPGAQSPAEQPDVGAGKPPLPAGGSSPGLARCRPPRAGGAAAGGAGGAGAWPAPLQPLRRGDLLPLPRHSPGRSPWCRVSARAPRRAGRTAPHGGPSAGSSCLRGERLLSPHTSKHPGLSI